MNKLVKTVNEDDLYPEFLRALNGILDLTDREMELLIELIKLDIGYQKLPGVNKNVVNTSNRKFIMHTMGLTKDNLSRYITRFKHKGILVKGLAEDEISVNKALIPDLINDRIQINLILKINKNEKNNN